MPDTVKLTGCPVLLKVRVPSAPDVDPAETLPAIFTVKAALALLVIEMEPPVPLPGAVTVTSPVTPLPTRVEPTTNALGVSL